MTDNILLYEDSDYIQAIGLSNVNSSKQSHYLYIMIILIALNNSSYISIRGVYLLNSTLRIDR